MISGPEKSRNNIREKISYFFHVWDNEVQKKTGILKGKPKVAYSVALVLVFLTSENENRQLEDLPLADFGLLPERLLLSVRT